MTLFYCNYSVITITNYSLVNSFIFCQKIAGICFWNIHCFWKIVRTVSGNIYCFWKRVRTVSGKYTTNMLFHSSIGMKMYHFHARKN